MRLTTAAVSALLLLSAPAAQAQLPSILEPGHRVKVLSPSARGEFTVSSIDAEQIVLTDGRGRTHVVLSESVQRLEVSRGYRSRAAGMARGAGLGFLVGAASGAVIGYSDGDDSCPQTSFCLFAMTAGDKAAVFGLLLGGVGGGIGGAIGAFSPGERWERVRLPGSLALVPTGSGVAASLRF